MTELQLDPRNARRHSDKNKRQIKQSLETVGAGRSILADADGIVRAGNGVFAEWGDKPVKIVETDGTELVVVQRTDLRGQAAIRAAALDNLVGDSSALEYEAEILKEITNDDALVKAIAEEDYRLRLLLNGPEQANDPNAEWTGMPEFHQEDLSAWKSLKVNFRSPLDLQEFAKLIGQNLTEHTRSIWYPKADRIDMSSQSYQDES